MCPPVSRLVLFSYSCQKIERMNCHTDIYVLTAQSIFCESYIFPCCSKVEVVKTKVLRVHAFRKKVPVWENGSGSVRQKKTLNACGSPDNFEIFVTSNRIFMRFTLLEIWRPFTRFSEMSFNILERQNMNCVLLPSFRNLDNIIFQTNVSVVFPGSPRTTTCGIRSGTTVLQHRSSESTDGGITSRRSKRFSTRNLTAMCTKQCASQNPTSRATKRYAASSQRTPSRHS